MKQPKKLTRRQKEVLRRKGHDEKQFMLLTEDNTTFTVISKEANEYGNYEQYTYNQ